MAHSGLLTIVVSMSANKGGFLLLKPKISGNADRIARSIAMCREVEEVFLTTGQYGFVVSLNTSDSKSIQKMKSKIKNVIGTTPIKAAISHYSYSKRYGARLILTQSILANE